MRALAALLLILTAAASPTGPHDVLAPDTEARWVPFDLTPGNQIRFTAIVDGAPVSAVLDTGVSVSVVSRAYILHRRLHIRPAGSAAAIGGSVSVDAVTIGSLSLGGLTRSEETLSVATLPDTATGSTWPIDMLIGRDVTAGYALDIDFAAHRFRLLPSGRIPFRGFSAPLAIAADRKIYVSELIIGGARLRPILIDTGDGAAITLTDHAWRFVKPDLAPQTTALSYGLGGPMVTGLAIVPHVVSGTAIADDVEVRIEPEGAFSDAIGMEGRVGVSFMQRYRVLLDPGAGHMLLRPVANTDFAPLRSTSGLLVAASNGRLTVLHVMRGGPADARGWRTGDTICSIDGRPVPQDYAGSAAAGWSIGTPGRTVALGLCDGRGTRELTLRQFY
jgi:hypothetical protein